MENLIFCAVYVQKISTSYFPNCFTNHIENCLLISQNSVLIFCKSTMTNCEWQNFSIATLCNIKFYICLHIFTRIKSWWLSQTKHQGFLRWVESYGVSNIFGKVKWLQFLIMVEQYGINSLLSRRWEDWMDIFWFQEKDKGVSNFCRERGKLNLKEELVMICGVVRQSFFIVFLQVFASVLSRWQIAGLFCVFIKPESYLLVKIKNYFVVRWKTPILKNICERLLLSWWWLRV